MEWTVLTFKRFDFVLFFLCHQTISVRNLLAIAGEKRHCFHTVADENGCRPTFHSKKNASKMLDTPNCTLFDKESAWHEFIIGKCCMRGPTRGNHFLGCSKMCELSCCRYTSGNPCCCGPFYCDVVGTVCLSTSKRTCFLARIASDSRNMWTVPIFTQRKKIMSYESMIWIPKWAVVTHLLIEIDPVFRKITRALPKLPGKVAVLPISPRFQVCKVPKGLQGA